MRFPEEWLAELRQRIPMAELVGRKAKLERSGREWVALCPFHAEKTPSFHVYDDRAHCYGCGWHGDAFAFVMRTTGQDFRYAVEQLAADAGMNMPEDPADRGRRLILGLLDGQAECWAGALFGANGDSALIYLKDRGLDEAILRRFQVGWAEGPLIHASTDRLKAAGLLRMDDDGQPLGPLFRRRIIFPIHDARGAVIGYSGRSLQEGAPKYINSPDTEFFHKGSVLYGLFQARKEAPADLVIVEGQMDALSLWQAGIPAVAPLGTALTPEQIRLAWTIHPSPTLLFDGDSAGSQALCRALDRALPMLTPERTLRIAAMPLGYDPASLIQDRGHDAIRAILSRAKPVADALLDMLRRDGDDVTPEGRAAYRARLESAAKRIEHRALASQYRQEFLSRHFTRYSRFKNRMNAETDNRRPSDPIPVRTVRTDVLDRLDEQIDEAQRLLTADPTEENEKRYIALLSERPRVMQADMEEMAYDL